MNSPPDPEFETFLYDVVEGVELDFETDVPTPDLAAVVALAHQLDPNRVPEAAVDEVASYAPVVTLSQGRRFRDTRDDLAMDALVAQVRAQVDQEVAQELSQPAAKPVEPRPTPRYWWVGVLVAAALVVGIGIGTVQATRFFEDSTQPDQNAALHSDREEESDTQTAEHREPAPEPKKVTPSPEPEPEQQAPAPEEIELEDEEEAVAQPRKRRRKKEIKEVEVEVAPPPETRAEKISRLDREANAAWKAGQLGKADKLFTEITRLDKGGRFAGLAYGDLFTLARQRKDKAREASLWKAYLKRFPRGRFADDARAGLCRRMSGDARAQCWTKYLEDMPKGSYRAQAKRESGTP